MDGSELTNAVPVQEQLTLSKPSSVDSSAPLEELLRSVDWGFPVRAEVPPVESIHPYPAKFIGDIPRTLIDLLPIPNDTVVLDPFCGSGTTLVEAQRAGLPSIGVDLNPIACLISRVKTSPLEGGFLEAATEIAGRAKRLNEVPSPDIPNVDHWFKKDVQLAVGALAKTITGSTYAGWLDPLRLALSSILVRVSNQESDTRYAAIDKPVSGGDVYEYFLSAAKKLDVALRGRDWVLPEALVIENDVLKVSSSDIGADVGMVITSPPYPNAYEYWLYHKYRMWWLGFDPLAVKEQEIGARAHFFKKNRHTAELFVDQMRGVFSLVSSVLVSGGFVCFVVGRSKIHGEIVDNGDIVEKVAKENNLHLVDRFDRVMNAKRKSFNLAHANIKTETVLVFEKK